MKNRFKFRAWLTKEKRMFDVVNLQWNREGLDASEELTVYDYFRSSDYILMQCTGLSATKSYRGDMPEDLLIFEGDIIRHETIDLIESLLHNNQSKENQYSNSAVIFDNKTAGFEFDNKSMYGNIMAISAYDDVEIIGNIYEHSELLKN